VQQKKGGIFFGWWVLIACAITQLYFNSTFVSGFTAFFNPLVDEFGWSYALVSLGSTFRGFEMGIFAPVIGYFTDKFRPRKLLFSGAILGAVGYFFFSRIQALWSFYAAFAVLGLSLSMSSQVVVMTAIASWFKKRTSLAMGIGAAGAAAGGLLLPFLVWLIDTVGWRSTLEFFAIGSLVICFPLAFIVREPSGEVPQEKPVAATGKPVTETRWEVVKDILRTRNFWLLSIAILLAGSTNSAIMAHQIPYIVSTGLTRETAGLMAAALSVSNITGRIGIGWLGDLIDKRYCYVIASLVQAGGLILFSYATTVEMFLPSMLLIGLGLGGFMPLRAAIQLDFFGLRAFAVIQGLIMVFVTISSMISPPLAGWYYDTFNNYQPAWYTFAALSAAAVPVILATSTRKAVGEIPGLNA